MHLQTVSGPAIVPQPRMRAGGDLSRRWLQRAGVGWIAALLLAQLLFASYLVALYGVALATGEVERWNAVMTHGHVDGHPIANGIRVLHVLAALALMLAGSVQLLPVVRRRWPRAHRWSGRVFLLTVLLLAGGGAVLAAWPADGAEAIGDLPQMFGNLGNAVLVFVFAAQAWRSARARQLSAHRRWALRLYVVAFGVLLFRLALSLSLLLAHGPWGFDPDSFTGPWLTFLSHACWLLPWVLIEIWFRLERAAAPLAQWCFAGLLGLATVATLAGTAAALLILWRPYL